jgi:hypothetical protein
MKWLFIALLVVNLGLVGFQWIKHREQVVVPEFEQVEGVASIVLLSDNVGARVEGGEAKSRCVLMGPILGEDVLEVVRAHLGDGGQDIRIVENEVEKAPSYWVYILDKDVFDGIEGVVKGYGVDGYRISGGELKGGFSLGVFENVDLARKLVKTVKKAGLNAHIHKKKNKKYQYWLEYGVDYAAENPQKITEITSFLKEDAKKREFFCKSVASGK